MKKERWKGGIVYMLYFRGEIDESKSQLLLPVLVPLLKPL